MPRLATVGAVSDRRGLRSQIRSPLHQVALAAVLLDQPGVAITLPTPAFSAFDVEDVELALNIAEDDVTAGHGGILHRYARPITAAGTNHPCLSWRDGHQVED
jgi:hypothetical protein